MNNPTILSGPVHPIPIPFQHNEDVDFGALRSYCDYLVEGGAKHLLVTVGTSRFNLLSREEMMKVNQTVADAGKGKVTVIASGPGPNTSSTRENEAFAKASADSGADAMIAVYPERWYGDDPLVEFFHRVADASPIPLWVHAVPMRDGFGGVHAVKSFGLEALTRVAAHDNVVGIKEENGDRALFESILAALKDQVSIIGAGGAMRRFMKDRPLGSTLYLVGTESLMPELGTRYHAAMMAGDLELAESIAVANEDPFFGTAVRYGWHRSLKESLHILGLMPPFERHPFTRVDEAAQADLRAIITQIGWKAK